MSAAKRSPRQRLAALTEHALVQAERRADAGETVSARELNGIRRLIERQEADEELAELRHLTTG